MMWSRTSGWIYSPLAMPNPIDQVHLCVCDSPHGHANGELEAGEVPLEVRREARPRREAARGMGATGCGCRGMDATPTLGPRVTLDGEILPPETLFLAIAVRIDIVCSVDDDAEPPRELLYHAGFCTA